PATAEATDADAESERASKGRREADAASRAPLADEVAYLQELQMEARIVGDAEQAIAARTVGDQEIATRLMEAAKSVETRAVSNIKALFAEDTAMAKRPNEMDEKLAAGRTP